MYINKIVIRNFRSINSLSISLDKLNMLCGPNSTGKSNILKALALSFELSPDNKVYVEKVVRDNLISSKQSTSAHIQVELTFKNAPNSLYTLANENRSNPLIYTFKATKSGNIIRKIGQVELNKESFKILTEKFNIIYIPTIRDLENDGLMPFKKLFQKVMYSARNNNEMKKHLQGIRQTLSKKASQLLGEQKTLVQNVLHASGIELKTDEIELEYIYENLSLQIKNNMKQNIPMSNIGTGHQSAVIINLYKQFGQSTPGHTLYLFEEPDAHLHPPTIRAIGNELQEISNSSQVLVSTHSPILISHLGLDKVLYLKHNQSTGTKVFPTKIATETQGQLSHKLFKYGLRITEALFTKLVVLVEGAADAVVIGRMVELMTGCSSDQLDLVITPAGGKDNMVELAKILKKLNIDWIAVFDYDAALTTSSIPITNASQDIEDVGLQTSLNTLLDNLNLSAKRGRNVQTQIKLLLSELIDGTPTAEIYDNSTLKSILEDVCEISQTRANSIKSALKNNKILLTREMLGKENIWLMRPDLEHTLLGKENINAPIIDPILRSKGLLNVPPEHSSYNNSIRKKLHSSASDSDLLIEVVDAIYTNSGFNRSDLNMAVKKIVDMVTSEI